MWSQETEIVQNTWLRWSNHLARGKIGLAVATFSKNDSIIESFRVSKCCKRNYSERLSLSLWCDWSVLIHVSWPLMTSHDRRPWTGWRLCFVLVLCPLPTVAWAAAPAREPAKMLRRVVLSHLTEHLVQHGATWYNMVQHSATSPRNAAPVLSHVPSSMLCNESGFPVIPSIMMMAIRPIWHHPQLSQRVKNHHPQRGYFQTARTADWINCRMCFSFCSQWI
jgi:hypothetical protein